MDQLSKKKRSWNMSRIKGKNTKPELIVRSFLHNAGFRYRVHRKDLPGKPDIVISKFRTVIFVNGCFWHRHPGCKMAYTPKSNVNFWKEKFEKTIERDKMAIEALEANDWKIITVWECQCKKEETLVNALKPLMNQRDKER